MNQKVINYPAVKNFSWFSLGINIFIFVGLACFSLSLFLPVFFTSAEDIFGFWVLLAGWIGLVFAQIAWFANPINLLALLLARDKPRIALLLSFLALLLASSTFNFSEIPTGLNHEKVFIKEFGAGFYFWFVAQVFVSIALFIRFIESIQKN